MKAPKSYTGRFLKELFDRRAANRGYVAAAEVAAE
jgi:hypothetical protein